MGKASIWIWNSVGHCMYCMRRSFRALVCAMGVLCLVYVLDAPTSILVPTLFVTAALGLLWLAHVLAFGFRRFNRDHKGIALADRRTALLLFGQAIAATALSTAALAVDARTHQCYCCAGSAPENCGCDTVYSCAQYGRCNPNGNC
jgi:hypothetical protein